MWNIIVAAGWPIWPLIFASIVVVAIIIERCVQLRMSSHISAELVQEVCANVSQFKDTNNLAQLAAHNSQGTIMAGGIAAAIRTRDWHEAMQTEVFALQRRLEKHLDVLSLLASAAPLMGLLGTVVGMIEIFAVQGQAMQGPEALASGIAVALYNTAFGLIVALPALIAYRLFKVRIARILDALEASIEPFIQLLEQSTKPSTKRSSSTQQASAASAPPSGTSKVAVA